MEDKKPIKKEKKPAESFAGKSVEWEALEYNFHKKSDEWFIFVGLGAVILFIVAVFMKNFLLSVLILVSTLAIFVYAIRPPQKVKFRITDKGFSIGGKWIVYDMLKSFWIFYDPPHTKYVSLKSKKVFYPYIQIPLGEANPGEIHNFLIHFIPEKRQQESLVDGIARVIRF